MPNTHKRRAIIFTGVVVSALALITSTAAVHATSKTQRLQRHLDRVRDLAFCEKGYEIASSFPSYAARNASKVNRDALIKQSDDLNERKEIIGGLLRNTFKVEAIDLGMDSSSYDNFLHSSQSKAELEAVISFQSVQEPQEFLDQLNGICEPLIN